MICHRPRRRGACCAASAPPALCQPNSRVTVLRPVRERCRGELLHVHGEAERAELEGLPVTRVLRGEGGGARSVSVRRKKPRRDPCKSSISGSVVGSPGQAGRRAKARKPRRLGARVCRGVAAAASTWRHLPTVPGVRGSGREGAGSLRAVGRGANDSGRSGGGQGAVGTRSVVPVRSVQPRETGASRG